MLITPKKIKGIRLKCMSCKWEISNSGICHSTGKNITSCPNKSQHRYCLLVCVPMNHGKRISKVLPANTSLETAIAELNTFKQELQKNNYLPVAIPETPPKSLLDFAMQYLDSLSGKSRPDTPDFLMRKRSKEYVGDCRLAIERFIIAIKKKGYPIDTFRLDELTDTEVGIYHDYLHKLGLGNRSYTKYIGACKAFLNWTIRVKDQQINNPFAHVELRTESKEPCIITKCEFERLLEVVSKESGKYRDKIKTRDVYNPWLKAGFRLAVESGMRRENIVTVRWSDVVEMEPGVLVIRVQNLKVNRINGTDTGRMIFVPVTKSLKALLEELGYEEKRTTTGFILERPDGTNVRYMMDSLSRGFAHYIKQASERKLEFKCLRKNYFTAMVMALGDKTRLMSGHSNSQTLKNHYVSSAFLAGKLNDFEIFK